MTLINHALTGATIGLLTGRPLIALPAALLSHFVCDAIPHYGKDDSIKTLGGENFKRYLIIDISSCVGLVVILAVFMPRHWLLASVCAFLATSPDSLWFAGWRRTRHGKEFAHPNRNALLKFAGAIQWFQKPSGAFVEAAWFVAGALIVGSFL